VTRNLKRLLAAWFVVQIVLPFTAPLQVCDLWDLLGTHSHHGPVSPEASSTPTPNDAESDASAFVSPLALSTLSASANLMAVPSVAPREWLTREFNVASSPHVQQTILRL
jgi:hypothetical protein